MSMSKNDYAKMLVHSMLGYSIAQIGGTYVKQRPDLDSSLPEHFLVGTFLMLMPSYAISGLGLGITVHDLPDTIANPLSLLD